MVALEASFASIVTRATLRDGLKFCMGPRA
jgi:hypothetical protein